MEADLAVASLADDADVGDLRRKPNVSTALVFASGVAVVAIAVAVIVSVLRRRPHRIEHRVSLLWGHHSVHHSSTAFDLTTSLRVAWHDGLTAALVYGPLAFLGLEPTMIVVLIQVNLLLQVWIHTQEIDRVPGLQGIINTPAAHRVHHASTPHALDSNYGGFLMIWDRLFGTYRREEDVVVADGPLRFGLTTGSVGTNPLHVTTAHYRAIAQRWQRGSSLALRVLAVLGPPEWTPEGGFAETSSRSLWRVLTRKAGAW